MAIGGALSVGLIGLKAFIIQLQAFVSPGLPFSRTPEYTRK